ncbi:MAG: DUF4058 family protein [Anaerolineae bacterium]|nr:MAG: DUF4058 family protein [Anaerolineae bacterium]
MAIFGSRTHLAEIDLLRAGEPMPMNGCPPDVAYRILISRAAPSAGRSAGLRRA